LIQHTFKVVSCLLVQLDISTSSSQIGCAFIVLFEFNG